MRTLTGGQLDEQLRVLQAVLDPRAFAGVSECLSSLIDRAIIGRLATDDCFALIRDYPAIYAGESAKRIDDRLIDLGIDLEARRRLLPQLKRILVRGEALGSRRAPIGDAVVRAVCARLASSGRDTLRCTTCGYHFRPADMSESRRKVAEEFGLRLSLSLRVERIADQIKTASFTGMQIDHIVPRAGWGPTDAINLQVLCELCNQGKLMFHDGFEAISVVLAGAYSLYISSAYRPNRTIFYSCMAINGSRCGNCHRGATDIELTVRPTTEWYTPWTVDVLCYECITGAGDTTIRKSQVMQR